MNKIPQFYRDLQQLHQTGSSPLGYFAPPIDLGTLHPYLKLIHQRLGICLPPKHVEWLCTTNGLANDSVVLYGSRPFLNPVDQKIVPDLIKANLNARANPAFDNCLLLGTWAGQVLVDFHFLLPYSRPIVFRPGQQLDQGSYEILEPDGVTWRHAFREKDIFYECDGHDFLLHFLDQETVQFYGAFKANWYQFLQRIEALSHSSFADLLEDQVKHRRFAVHQGRVFHLDFRPEPDRQMHEESLAMLRCRFQPVLVSFDPASSLLGFEASKAFPHIFLKPVTEGEVERVYTTHIRWYYNGIEFGVLPYRLDLELIGNQRVRLALADYKYRLVDSLGFQWLGETITFGKYEEIVAVKEIQIGELECVEEEKDTSLALILSALGSAF